MDNQTRIYQLIILGAGPAGTAAGVYAARKKIDTLIITENFGGQAVVAAKIENIIGFEEISGVEMAQRFEKQLRRYSELNIVLDKIVEIKEEKSIFAVKTNREIFYGERILAALGRRYRHLGVPKEKELEGKGVFYCSTCDAPLMKNKEVAVIGGGNSALLRKITHQTNPCVGMKSCKEPLGYRICKYFFDELISMISGTKSIAMPEIKFFQVVLFLYGFPVQM